MNNKNTYKELIIKKGTPLLNYVYVTSDRYTAEESAAMNGGLVMANQINQLKPYQKIKAISPRISVPYKEGDMVAINITRYGRPIQKKDMNSIDSSREDYYASMAYHVPVVEIDGVEYLKLGDNDIDMFIEEYEFKEIESKSIIETPKTEIYTGKGKNIILN